MKRNYIHKEKNCPICNTNFVPTGQNHKYCSKDCQKIVVNKKQTWYGMKYRINKGQTLVGVGRGGRTKESNGAYKNNISYFLSMSNIIRDELQKCERCGKDLFNAKRGSWALHHKDHNRNNNVLENFELLCRSCHAKEHKAEKAFEGVTTTERDPITGRYKRIEAPSTQTE